MSASKNTFAIEPAMLTFPQHVTFSTVPAQIVALVFAVLLAIAIAVDRKARNKFRFTIRDILWFTFVVALIVGWWIDHRQFSRFEITDTYIFDTKTNAQFYLNPSVTFDVRRQSTDQNSSPATEMPQNETPTDSSR